MSLKIVKCDEPTIISFYNNIKKEDHVVKHVCIEESKARRPNSLILGKIVKVLSYSAERFILLVKECLPGFEYGGKFKAVVHRSTARELVHFCPQTGDRVAFPEPFIFLNPAYEPENPIEGKPQPKYLLECKYGEGILMWFAKKQEMGGKSDDDKRGKQVIYPEKSLQHKAYATSKQPGGSTLGKSAPSDGKTKKQTGDVQTSESVHQKSAVQLPQNPQILGNTKRPSPQYTYQTISSINSIDLWRSRVETVNTFGVIYEIIEPISVTYENKFKLVCQLVDDSDEENGIMNLHFCTPEDTVIKQIEVGDVIRLHRLKVESYYYEIYGRVFYSQDIVVFKKNFPNISPILIAKTTLITDEEKRRVESLKKWYIEYLRRPILLSDIYQSGKYTIFVKVVMREPKREGNAVKIRVSDGTVIKNIVPSYPLQRYKRREGKKDHIVIEITAYNKLDEYASLKLGDFVLFYDVEVEPTQYTKLRLKISSETSPEISIDKTPQAEDIECRIKQFSKSVTDQPKDKNDSDKSEREGAVEVVENNQNVVPSSTDQENGTSVQTRQQKNKQKMLPAKNVERTVRFICFNKSCDKPKSTVLSDDCDGKNTESDSGTKSRKQLFTPNYRTDLSYAASDETSEHNLEMSKHAAVNKVPDVVNPANTNFNDIVEKVKTKYCTPKRQEQLGISQDEEGVVRRSSPRKTREGNELPVVMVERLSYAGSEGNSNSRMNTNIKRGLQEDIEDVETVVNMSHKIGTVFRSNQENKRTRLESLSTEEGNQRINDDDLDHELEKRGQKVCSRLFHPNNRILACQQEDVANDEFDLAVIKQILCSNEESPDMSKYISASCFRVQAFLLEVLPEPSLNPLDLVSGYCHSGCQQMFLYSAIKWHQEENINLPLCPDCFTIEQEKELLLMLMMRLVIMDPLGHHREVIAIRDQAELFLNCSATEFLKDEVVRKSRVQLLMDNTIQNTYRSPTTPLLDIAIIPMKSIKPIYLLVNATLKLPRF